jgi:hypothetical protein
MGFANTAFMAWTLNVNSVISTAKIAVMINYPPANIVVDNYAAKKE